MWKYLSTDTNIFVLVTLATFGTGNLWNWPLLGAFVFYKYIRFNFFSIILNEDTWKSSVQLYIYSSLIFVLKCPIIDLWDSERERERERERKRKSSVWILFPLILILIMNYFSVFVSCRITHDFLIARLNHNRLVEKSIHRIFWNYTLSINSCLTMQ